ncbi:putative protein kinase RLK-Pelle-LRR-XI-1 family [Helianthus anomalus]
MVTLIYLDLSTNQLNASIPNQITHLQTLEVLILADNNFDDPIPSNFGNLYQLRHLNLSMNSLSGPIPLDMSNLISRIYILDFSSNQVAGNVSFQYPCYLRLLDLSMNLISGDITSLSVRYFLQDLDLSSNKLDGEIPLLNFSNFDYLNLSNNHLTGMVPCDLPASNGRVEWSYNDFTCYTKQNKLVLYLGVFLPIIFGFFFLVICITDIKKDFDLRYCIGTGGYGSVYEAKLPNGQTFALKKLHHFEAEQPTFNQSFKNKVQVLTNLRHKNIVKLYGFCLHNKCNFLVYEYMEKGSLFCALSDCELAVQVDWIKRVNIIKDVAHALAYMHHDCSPPIVHRDISTNNILLNSEMEGFVADFGVARLLDPDSSNQTAIVGTLGYIAPGICT